MAAFVGAEMSQNATGYPTLKFLAQPLKWPFTSEKQLHPYAWCAKLYMRKYCSKFAVSAKKNRVALAGVRFFNACVYTFVNTTYCIVYAHA